VKLALRPILGALGAAAGTLPLLPIVRAVAGGGEPIPRAAKASIWPQAAVLLCVVPAVAFVFGRALPRWIRARGGFAVALPGLGLASSFPLWRWGLHPAMSILTGLAVASAITALSVLGPRILLGRVDSESHRSALAAAQRTARDRRLQ